VAAIALVPLGKHRYALLEKESDDRAAHADAGAVSIAYLERRGRAWRRLGAWREIAWGGESGGSDLKAEVRRGLGRDPVLVVRGSHLGQGYLTESAVIVRLGFDRPTALGRIPLGADNTGGADEGSREYHYKARLARAAPPVLLKVEQFGWTAPRLDGPRRPYRQSIAFLLEGGCLKPVGAPPLLDAEWPGSQPEDCTATAPPAAP
jgi:hypothetical protein